MEFMGNSEKDENNLFDMLSNTSFQNFIIALRIFTFILSSVIVFLLLKNFLNSSPIFEVVYFLINFILSFFILYFKMLIPYEIAGHKYKTKISINLKEKFSGLGTLAKDSVNLISALGLRLSLLIVAREIIFNVIDSIFKISVIWLIGTWVMVEIAPVMYLDILSAGFSLVGFATFMTLIEIIFGFSKYIVDKGKEKVANISNQLNLYTTMTISHIVNYENFMQFLKNKNDSLHTYINEYVNQGLQGKLQFSGFRGFDVLFRKFSNIERMNTPLMFQAIEEEAKQRNKNKHDGKEVELLTMSNLRNAYKEFFSKSKKDALREIKAQLSEDPIYFMQIRDTLLTNIVLLEDVELGIFGTPESRDIGNKKAKEKLQTFDEFYKDFAIFCAKALMSNIVMPNVEPTSAGQKILNSDNKKDA